MTQEQNEVGASASSAKLFANFVARKASGERLDFAQLRTDSPQFAEEFQALEEAWISVREVLEQLGIARSFTRCLSDPEPSENTELHEADRAVLEEVVERLALRSASFSRYLVEGEVGSGGMGAVLRVWDSDLRRDLAMKVVLDGSTADPDSKSDPRILTRFIEEAQVTGQLDHPGIVPVHELGVDAQGRVYFTMRLVSGRDLEEILGLVERGEEGWSLTRATGVLLKVCEAMAYAHSKCVIHRDLKPANIMIGRFGEVYVMDWGLAHVSTAERKAQKEETRGSTKVFTDLQAAKASNQSAQVTLDGDVVGTPAYMSPEQARGDTQGVGPLSDVYSAGAILYHMLALRTPYVEPGEKPSAFDIWKRVRAGAPPSLAGIAPQAPVELVAICQKAMSREPEARYANMLELAEDLRAYLEGRVVHAYEQGAIAEFRKWVRRNKALALTVIASTVLITAASLTASIVLADMNEDLTLANATSKKNEEKARKNERLAITSAEEATRNAVLAQERADEVLRLSDVTGVAKLDLEAELLWPPLPSRKSELTDWLRSAGEMVERLTLHASTLHRLRTRATSSEPWTFASTEDQWQHDTLSTLVSQLRALADSETGLIRDVERRLEFAKSVEDRSLTGTEARRRWAEALASFADSELYVGGELIPQLGLLPLGVDPESGLLEFAHLQSGVPAVRDEYDQLMLTEDSGIVLILLPGGRFTMGAQAEDEDAPNFSMDATEKEVPPHEVEVSSFFLSKYELTQGQWLRATGTNPSLYGPETSFGEIEHTLLHPVEQVSWDEASLVASRLDLALPTEAQWEYACRAGSATPWANGPNRIDLIGSVNLADLSVVRAGENWPTQADWPELDDGFPLHAPVGSFLPNAFGLHDTAGNVWEWCRDGFGFYNSPVQGPEAEREATHPQFKINRGGSYYHASKHARSSHRNQSAPETKQNHLGVRLSRTLERP